MIGGKAHGRNRPTALGTMLNAATYGLTIPTIYGMTRSTFLAIWAANLREGGSGKKSKKKGVKTYVENVDFLIGSNPILNVAQMWSNNTNNYTLDVAVQSTAVGGFGASTITITDPDFYSVIGVTADVRILGIFNDYGDESSGAIATYSFPSQGS